MYIRIIILIGLLLAICFFIYNKYYKESFQDYPKLKKYIATKKIHANNINKNK